METELFNKKQLYALIIPLVIEQVLAVLVGMADIVMVSQAGEAAVSGVSLVDSINILLINIFTALATGGAVVCARYLGQRHFDSACRGANQLLLIMAGISLLLTTIAVLGNHVILRLIFGKVDDLAVLKNAEIYFYLTALSFPGLAIYNAGAALCRAMGNSKISMKVSFLMNAINIVGNAICIFGLHMGVEGVALPTLLSRSIAGAVMIAVVLNKKQPLHVDFSGGIRFNFSLIREILHIGIPNGMENSLFQLGKIMVQSLIAGFGTAAIAANAVGNTIAGIEIIPGQAIGLSLITVVGQAVGAKRYQEAERYIKKLMLIAYGAMAAVSVTIVILLNPITSLYNLSPEALQITRTIVIYHSVCCVLIWPLSFTLPNAMRASGDVMFTMWVSMISMWLCRIGFSYILAKGLHMGVFGVWVAMTLDWAVRTAFFVWRMKTGKWKKLN